MYQYMRPNVDSLFGFKVMTRQHTFLEVASFKRDDSSSEYNYDNLLLALIDSIHVGYPLNLFIELYQMIDDELLTNRMSFEVNELGFTRLYQIKICNQNELKKMLHYFYESGMDSLFNTITKSTKKVSIDRIGNIELLADQDSDIPCFSFTHDLQGLMLFGHENWSNKTYVKEELLKGSLLLDEVDVY